MPDLNFNIPYNPTKAGNRGHSLVNREFGSYRIIALYGRNKHHQLMWLCRCTCGHYILISTLKFNHQVFRQCKCQKPPKATLKRPTLRQTYKNEYWAYAKAKQRCQNPKNPEYFNYGGRGIEFRFESFEELFDEIGCKPTPKHTLDRYPNNKTGHYERGNVRWATQKEQCQNKRNNVLVTAQDRTLCVSEWSDVQALNRSTVRMRIIRGACPQCAVKLRKYEAGRRMPKAGECSVHS